MEEFGGKYKKQFNYIASHYEFRFNVVTSLYEFRKLDFKKGKTHKKGDWLKYEDRTRNRLLLELMELDLDISKEKFDLFIESEFISPDYNPFVEYFEQLKPWDGKTDYIKELSKTVKTANEKRFYSTITKFLVGTLDCLLEVDAVNDVCLVFQSAQGDGKTRWMRQLLPKQFRDEYLYEGNINTNDKDHVMYLSQYWFIHLDELETLKKNDIAAIKSYITRQRISLRKAFGRYKNSFVRRASFLGSVNEDKFLTDVTGNRRWLVFPTKHIDYEHRVDIDGLWAQVYHIWNNGSFKHWFDHEEIKEINQINETFRTMPFEEEMLLKYFGFPEEEVLGEYMSSSEVMMKINEIKPGLMNKLNSVNMGRSLSKHCPVKKTLKGVQKYYLEYTVLDAGDAEEALKTVPDTTSAPAYVASDGNYNEDDELPF